MGRAFTVRGIVEEFYGTPWSRSGRLDAISFLAPRGHPSTLPPDAEAGIHHAFALIYMWMAARADEHVVYGPRFAIYPAVVQLPDGRPTLDARPADAGGTR